VDIISRKEAKERRLKHYFTGVPCDHNHISKRSVKLGHCTECKAVYYRTHKEQVLASISQWQKDNKAKVNAATQKWRDEKSDDARACVQLYYQNNTEKKLANNKQWRQDNPDVIRLYNTKRRSQLVIATPIWSDLITIAKVYKQTTIIQEQTGEKYHVDHIIPLNHKLVCGLHVPDNLQIIKGELNMKKGNRFKIF
jgi:hypothetical protein